MTTDQHRALMDVLERLVTQTARLSNAVEENLFFDEGAKANEPVDACKACGCRIVPSHEKKCTVCGADMPYLPLHNDTEETNGDRSDDGRSTTEGA